MYKINLSITKYCEFGSDVSQCITEITAVCWKERNVILVNPQFYNF
jgi:hypothetical protein